MRDNTTDEIYNAMLKALAVLAFGLALLRERAQIDPLTNLFNRRTYDERLETLSVSKATDTPVSLILGDIDNFKRCNESLNGLDHRCGDMYIRGIGHILKHAVREGDYAQPFRKGGDEFALLLQNAPLPVAVERAHEVKKAIKQMRLAVPHGGIERFLPPVTMSMGIGAIPEHGSTVKQLIEAATVALAQAKARRAGTIVVASTILPSR